MFSAIARWIESLQRPGLKSKVLLPSVDGLRCVAIVWVIFFHAGVLTQMESGTSWANIPAIASTGHLGVQLFFVISGFVLSLPYARGQPLPLRDYYYRRLVRIEPPFLICILLLFVSQLARGLSHLPGSLGDLVTTLTYSHGLVRGEFSPINNVTWSLETEVQFYLLAPFLLRAAFCLPPRARAMALIAGVAGFGWMADAMLPATFRWKYSLASNFSLFLAGIFVADICQALMRRNRPKRLSFDLATLVLMGTCCVMPGLLEWRVTQSLLFGSFLLAVCTGKYASRLFAWSVFVAIGGMCYTIYLYHFAIIRALSRIGGFHTKGFDWPGWIVSCAICIFLCIIPYLCFERPFMKHPFKKTA